MEKQEEECKNQHQKKDYYNIHMLSEFKLTVGNEELIIFRNANNKG